MIWTTLIVVVSLAVGALAALKLAVWHRWFSTTERYGLGLLGAGSVMTIAPVLAPGSPFDQWAPIMFRIGVLVLMAGHILRYRKTGVSR